MNQEDMEHNVMQGITTHQDSGSNSIMSHTNATFNDDVLKTIFKLESGKYQYEKDPLAVTIGDKELRMNQVRNITKISIEKFLNCFLGPSNMEAHTVTYAYEESKRERVIFITEKSNTYIEECGGDTIIVFGMYVEEHGDDAPLNRRNTVYIQFLESTGIKTKQNPSVASRVIILYCNYVELQGYKRVHLWVDPPPQNNSWIFKDSWKNRPSNSNFDLREWYTKLFCQGGWKCSPYSWVPNIQLPPSYGSSDKKDAKNKPKVQDFINDAVNDLISRAKEFDDKFAGKTMVVELRGYPVQELDMQYEICTTQGTSYNSLRTIKVYSIKDIDFVQTDLAKSIQISNISGMSFEKRNASQSTQELLRLLNRESRRSEIDSQLQQTQPINLNNWN
jgi:hypothetical protein